MAKIYGYTRPPNAPAESTSSLTDRLHIELDVMRQIGDAVSSLPDDESRGRVLRWVVERLGASDQPVTARARPAASSDLQSPPGSHGSQLCASRADGDLAIDGVEMLFGEPRDLSVAGAGDRAAGQTAASMANGFVKQFQKLLQFVPALFL
jgi:hypothetical protein